MLMPCINVFQGQIKPFIDIYETVYIVKLFFPVFPTVGVQNLFFPEQYLLVNTAVKTGYCPKPSKPALELARNVLSPSWRLRHAWQDRNSLRIKHRPEATKIEPGQQVFLSGQQVFLFHV